MATPVTVRPARAPVPAMPPFAQLDRTHARVLEILQKFDKLIAHIDDNGADEVARASAAEIVSFFGDAARQHHADEERLVFPALLASADAELVHHVKRLQQDHGWLEEDWLTLAPQLEAIAEGFNWFDVAMLKAALPIFTALYHDHIALEESLVYPEAKRRLAELQAGAQARQA